MKSILFLILFSAVVSSLPFIAQANQKGETAHPVFKRTFTYE